MTDIEKVTQGIKACWSEHFCHRCFDCPYKTERDNKKCIERLGVDALELLKELEAEAVTPIITEEDDLYWQPGDEDYACGSCGETLAGNWWKYCPYCGRKVKWSI